MGPVQSKRALLCDLKTLETKKKKVLRSSCKVPDFNQIWIFSADFPKSFQYQFSLQSVQWGAALIRANRGVDGRNYSLIPFHCKKGFYGDLISPAKIRHIWVFIRSEGYQCPMLNKFGFSQQIFIKVSNVKSNRNPPIIRRADISGQTGRRKDSRRTWRR